MAARSDEPSQPIAISFVEFVVLCASLMAMTALSVDIMLPALPQIAGSFGVANENDQQLIIVLYMAGFSAGQIVFGPLSDHFGRKPVGEFFPWERLDLVEELKAAAGLEAMPVEA